VTDPDLVQQHPFFPFLTFTKRQRRFKSKGDLQGPKPSFKRRALAIPSHADGYVFAWYAFQLSQRYEKLIRAMGLHESVLAYRSGIGTNIAMAGAAFDEIETRPASLAVALDLADFFPSIDHAVLKANWAEVIGTIGLPADHFAVFRAMTRWAEVDRNACLARLGIDPKVRPLPRPLCSGEQFREIVRRAPPGGQNLLNVNRKPHGIPQGAQISAVLSNVSMLRFDSEMRAAAVGMGGSYRRYSDDILFIVNPEFSRPEVVAVVEAGLDALGTAMKLNHDKTESAQFARDASGTLRCDNASGIQYLGFTFDGERRVIRSQTMSKYARRLVYAARAATRAAQLAGTPVYRRGIYRRFSHLGKSNFISGYAAKARNVMKDDAIRRQVQRHMRHIAHQLDRK
jgi:RNA-directed DNA polymerase